MATVGTPYETAMAESFFTTLKCEGVYVQEYRTCEKVEAHLGRSIAEVYNVKRLHSSLRYRPLVELAAARLGEAPVKAPA